MDSYTTPPPAAPDAQLATPVSLNWVSPKSVTLVQDTHGSSALTRTEVDNNSTTKRLQQDLLILTSFNDNTTLHWRPTWFNQELSAGNLWTMHNPPNVVTERLPNDCQGIQFFTRRMRRANDPPSQYIKSWDHWVRYCDLYGIPHDFLCEEQVRLMRKGLWRSPGGFLSTPPQYPSYPEPSSRGSYVLTPSIYSTRLPRKFQRAVLASPCVDPDQIEHVVVSPTGTLTIEPQDKCSRYEGHSKGYRWSCIPWTTEMEESCQPLTVKLRLWNRTGEGEKLEIIR